MKPQLSALVGKRIHFIGIGGAGMSGLARIALSHGITVSGSDAKDSSVVIALSALGATVSTTHAAENVEGSDLGSGEGLRHAGWRYRDDLLAVPHGGGRHGALLRGLG